MVCACVLVVAGGCSPQEARRTGVALYAGPQVEAVANPFGVTWGWDHVGALGDGLSAYAGGASVVEVGWCDTEPEPGRPDFASVDAEVDATARMGFAPLLRIRVGTCWATGDTGPSGPASRPPLDMNAYAAFVATVAARYSDAAGFGIEAAFDSDSSWAAPPEAYPAVLSVAADAVRRSAPGKAVVGAGISSVGTGVLLAGSVLAGGRPAAAVTLWDDFFSRRFEQADFPFQPARDVATLEAQLLGDTGSRVRAAAAVLPAIAAAADAVALEYFEKWQFLHSVVALLGAATGGSRPLVGWDVGIAWPGEDYDGAVAGDELAKLLVEGTLNGVERMVYRPAVSQQEAIGRGEVLRGLFLASGAPQPPADALVAMVDATAGGVMVVRRVGAPTGLRGAGFGHGSRSVLVVWSDAAPVQLHGAPPAGTEASTVMGEPLEWSVAGLTVGSTPVVIEADSPVGAAIDVVESGAR